MKNRNVKLNPRCTIRTTLDLLGGKWKLLIIHQLIDEPLRLSALKRQIPDISEKMLIQELKKLQLNGLVERKNFGEVPPRVEYSLASVTFKVIPLLTEMRNFAQAYEKEVLNVDNV